MAHPPPPPPHPPPIPGAPDDDDSPPPRPTLEGERHNSSDDSVATLASISTAASLTSISTYHSELGGANLVDEPLRRGSGGDKGGTASLEHQMQGLGLRERGASDSCTVPEFMRPPSTSTSPTTSTRPLLSNIVTSSSPYAGLVASSPVAPSSSLPFASTSPGISPSLAGSLPPAASTSSATLTASFPQRHSSPVASPFGSPRASLSSSTPSLRPNFGSSSSGGVPTASSSRAGSMPPSFGGGGGAPHHHASSSTRPSSADTFSTTSSSGRPWVFDSDASSICSATSSTGGASTGKESAGAGAGSGGSGRVFLNDEGREEVVEEGGEVYKPQGDYFLDDRPEPPNTSLDIDRSDPSQVIVRVRLPGFSLENITVAMRRGHKVHIVADSYGETGGHYEKLVTLGSDVSSAAPRAEFDGTLLRIFIHRRPSRPSSAVSVPGQVAPAPFGHGGHGHSLGSSMPGSPLSSSLSSSPDLSSLDHARRPSIASSLASAWSTDSYGSLPGSLTLSPSLESYAFGPPLIPLPVPGGGPDPSAAGGADDAALLPPCTARAGPPPDYHKRARCLTGPEGARAAAKAAREEAARRAKEEVKNLPQEARGGRRLPFRRQKEEQAAAAAAAAAVAASGSSSGGSGGEGTGSSPTSASCSAATSGSSSPLTSEESSPSDGLPPTLSVERGGTIKASSRTVSPLPSQAPTRPPLSHQSSGASTIKGLDAVTSHALDSTSTQLMEHLERSHDAATSPASGAGVRPKLRGGSLTLRPFDRAQSFLEAAATLATEAEGGASSPSASSDGGGATPRREERGMRFTPFST